MWTAAEDVCLRELGWDGDADATLLAKLLRPGVAGEKLLAAWRHTLKHAGGRRWLVVIEKFDRDTMPEETLCSAWPDKRMASA